MAERLLSVNIGLPRDINWRGKTVHTGIWKSPVPGHVIVRKLNIDGDGQGAGDEIVKVADGPEQMSVAEMDALLYLPGHNPEQLERALRIPALSWVPAGFERRTGGLGRFRRPGANGDFRPRQTDNARCRRSVAWISAPAGRACGFGSTSVVCAQRPQCVLERKVFEPSRFRGSL